MSSKSCFRILVLMLTAGMNLPGQSNPSACTERLKAITAGLAPYDMTREFVEQGAKGDGIRRAWMDQMSAYGIKSVGMQIRFSVSKGSANSSVTNVLYYRSYAMGGSDVPTQEIQDPALLKKIRESGLEPLLKAAAIDIFQQRLPETLHRAGMERASGTGYAILYDDECMRAITATTMLSDPDDTSLMAAARDNDVERARRLLAAGGDINAKDQHGRDAILEATSHPKAVELVRMLVGDGANPNSTDLIGETPLMQAAFYGDLETVDFLLQSNASIGARSKDGATPLLHSLSSGRASLDVVRELIRAGADVNSKDHNGTTPLIQATSSALPEAVKELLAAGADPSLRDKNGYTALDHAHGRTIERTQADDEIVSILMNASQKPLPNTALKQ